MVMEAAEEHFQIFMQQAQSFPNRLEQAGEDHFRLPFVRPLIYSRRRASEDVPLI
jgi:hypothetical protein